MTRKEKIFKTMYHKHTESILAYIYTNVSVSFKEICENFPNLTPSVIRQITNRLSAAKLIKSIRDVRSEDKRAKVYVIKNETATISILEMEV